MAPPELLAIPPPGPAEVLPETVLPTIVIGPLELFRTPPPPGEVSVPVLPATVESVNANEPLLLLLMPPPFSAVLFEIVLEVTVAVPEELLLIPPPPKPPAVLPEIVEPVTVNVP